MKILLLILASLLSSVLTKEIQNILLDCDEEWSDTKFFPFPSKFDCMVRNEYKIVLGTRYFLVDGECKKENIIAYHSDSFVINKSTKRIWQKSEVRQLKDCGQGGIYLDDQSVFLVENKVNPKFVNNFNQTDTPYAYFDTFHKLFLLQFDKSPSDYTKYWFQDVVSKLNHLANQMHVNKPGFKAIEVHRNLHFMKLFLFKLDVDEYDAADIVKTYTNILANRLFADTCPEYEPNKKVEIEDSSLFMQYYLEDSTIEAKKVRAGYLIGHCSPKLIEGVFIHKNLSDQPYIETFIHNKKMIIDIDNEKIIPYFKNSNHYKENLTVSNDDESIDVENGRIIALYLIISGCMSFLLLIILNNISQAVDKLILRLKRTHFNAIKLMNEHKEKLLSPQHFS